MASISSIHDASWDVITFKVAHEQAFERSQQTEKLSKQYKEKRSTISTIQKEISLENLEQEKLDINIGLYSPGFFDGLTGLNAELPHFKTIGTLTHWVIENTARVCWDWKYLPVKYLLKGFRL